MVVVHKQVIQGMIMTSGDKPFIIRKALSDDIDGIKQLADQHKTELGFVIRGALMKSINQGQLLVALDDRGKVVGFNQYRHRKDQQTTLYNIVVAEELRRSGIGSALLDELCIDASSAGKETIFLKCPQELPSNSFYESYGFTLLDVEQGKNRPLSLWQFHLEDA